MENYQRYFEDLTMGVGDCGSSVHFSLILCMHVYHSVLIGLVYSEIVVLFEINVYLTMNMKQYSLQKKSCPVLFYIKFRKKTWCKDELKVSNHLTLRLVVLKSEMLFQLKSVNYSPKSQLYFSKFCFASE